jgi:hypothetical protein
MWLKEGAAMLAAPWSLSWSILALAAHGIHTQPLVGVLLDLGDLDKVEDNCSLALVCLALDYRAALSAFGVGEL